MLHEDICICENWSLYRYWGTYYSGAVFVENEFIHLIEHCLRDEDEGSTWIDKCLLIFESSITKADLFDWYIPVISICHIDIDSLGIVLFADVVDEVWLLFEFF